MKIFASNPEIAERRRRFYDALRSGKYEQGREALRTLGNEQPAAYCCLGVACDVSKQGRWDGADYIIGSGQAEDVQDMNLPVSLMRYYEFVAPDDTGNPLIGLNTLAVRERTAEEEASAIFLNDTLGLTFAQIADAFEATYPCEVQNAK